MVRTFGKYICLYLNLDLLDVIVYFFFHKNLVLFSWWLLFFSCIHVFDGSLATPFLMDQAHEGDTIEIS